MSGRGRFVSSILRRRLKRDTLVCMLKLIKGAKVEDIAEDTNCYTYKVEMIIHLLSDSEPKAKENLDKNGGYVSSRKVTLLDCVPLLKE